MEAVDLSNDFDQLRGLLSRVTELSASLDLAIANKKGLGSNLKSLRVDTVNEANLLAYAKAMYSFRRKRSNWLPDDLFGEPAWDILLELFIMRLQNKRVMVKNACIASGVPATTALRWISVLEAKGLISSSSDSSDQRVRWIWLNDEAFQALYDMLAHHCGGAGETRNEADAEVDAYSKAGVRQR